MDASTRREVSQIDVQGHRGARGLRPENTLPGFALAAELGVTTLELDLHLTADDRLVVWHDPELSPDKCNIDAARRVRSLALAELREVVCDRNPNPARFPDQVAPAGEDFHLVDLEQVLALAPEKNLRFNVELKRVPSDPDAIGDDFDGVAPSTFERVLVDTVRRLGVVDRVTVQSFDHRALWAVATLEPNLELAALTEGRADLDELARRGAAVWSPSYASLSAADVERAQALGLRVVPWTVNEPSDIDQVLRLGVDGLISDRPDVVRSAVDRLGAAPDRGGRR